ncbi:MAG: sensor histidine kinase [Candidatus Omnitrophota bacterium]
MKPFRFSKKILDWGVMAGFAGLLCLIIAIGLIGIRQIAVLNRVAKSLARVDIPLQNAVFEMRINNARYASAIRNYLSWHRTRYLESASIVQRQDSSRTASENFNKYLDEYLSLSGSGSVEAWASTVRSSQEQLIRLGESIIGLVDQLDEIPESAKADTQAALARMQREFESKIFWIDAFLENPMQRDIFEKLDKKLAEAESGQRAAVTLLTVSLAVAIFLGLLTASLTYSRMRQDRRHREELWRRFVSAQEEERNNLSLQIHDEMGQDLSGLKIYLALLEKEEATLPQESKDKIEKAKTILDELMKKTHNISEILRPPEIDEVGLIQSIDGLVLNNKEITGAQYICHMPQKEPVISPEEKLVLYRVVQEALTNIAKYSEARQVEIRLKLDEHKVFLGIKDDGIGFDLEAQKHLLRRKEDKIKLGLQGLKERIELLDGTLRITSQPGLGTSLEVELPVYSY